MNEKRFQEVLEEVAYQRAFYREQRAQQMEEEEEQQVCLCGLRVCVRCARVGVGVCKSELNAEVGFLGLGHAIVRGTVCHCSVGK